MATPQTPTTRVRTKRTPPKRKVGDGNGKTVRTAQQLARQERCFTLSVMQNRTIRQIAAEVGIDTKTVMKDIRAEEQRRADEIADRREMEKARAVTFYGDIAKRALKKSDKHDEFIQRILNDPDFEGKINDRSLQDAISARERIDKILGIDAPTKVDLGLQALVDALNEE